MNNKVKFLLTFFVFFVIIFSNGVSAMAIDTGFNTFILSDEEQNIIADRINISVVNEEFFMKSIQSFDVNSTGEIVIGHSGINATKAISVYDCNGNFQYGYRFNCSGLFGVEWSGHLINIYLVRSNALLTIDKDANIVCIQSIENSIENNDYINNYIFATDKYVADEKYTIRNNSGILNFIESSYSQLVRISSEGDKFVLYDVTSLHTIKILAGLFSIVAFIVLVIYTLYKKQLK